MSKLPEPVNTLPYMAKGNKGHRWDQGCESADPETPEEPGLSSWARSQGSLEVGEGRRVGGMCDATMQALELEAGATSQGAQEAPGSWETGEERVPARAARRSSAFQTSDLQTCKSINPLCFKPLSWWQSVTVVEETRALAILSRCGQVNGVCRGPGGD